MRPIAQSQDPLRFPLDKLLRVESHVRILRVLAGIRVPISTAEIADYARINEQAARNALKNLVATGFVRAYGRKKQLYALREGDSLVDSLSDLFRAEHRRHSQVTDDLRTLMSQASFRPRVAWLRPATGERGVELCFVAGAARVASMRTALQQAVATVERGFDLTIHVVGFARADEPDLVADTIIYLEDASAVESDELGVGMSHAEQTARSLVWARQIASLAESTPDLVPRALSHVEHLLETDQGPAQDDLMEWRIILRDYSAIRLGQFLVSGSPRASRLRQSSPFPPVLSPDERQFVNGAPVIP